MRKSGRTIVFGFCSLILTGQVWADLTSCAIRNIHDGDTLKAWCPGPGVVKVRLHCIDAPEIKQRLWGAYSRDYLRALAGYGPVRIIQHDRDRYGRIVGEVVLGRQVLNLVMVQAGQAAVYPKYCQDERYYQAEKSAKRRKAGIWRVQGLHQTPWEYRDRKSEKQTEPDWWRWLRSLIRRD